MFIVWQLVFAAVNIVNNDFIELYNILNENDNINNERFPLCVHVCVLIFGINGTRNVNNTSTQSRK